MRKRPRLEARAVPMVHELSGADDPASTHGTSSGAVFRLLLDAAPEAMLVAGQDERLLFANARAEELCGYARAELLGRSVRTLVADGLAEAFRQLLGSHGLGSQRQASPVISDVIVRRKDGSELPVDAGLRLVATDNGLLFLVELRDSSPRKRREAEVELLREASLAVGAAADLTAALQSILEQVCKVTQASMGEAWLPDPGGTYLECSPAWCKSDKGLEEFRRGSERLSIPPGLGLVGRAWDTGIPVWVRDVGDETWIPRAALARAAGLQAAVAIPVFGEGRVVAVLVFFQRERRGEDGELIRLISILSAHLGNLILRKRTEEELRRSEARYRQIVTTAHEGIAIFDAEGRLSYVNQRLAEMLRYPIHELLGRLAVDFVFAEDRAEAERMLALRRERPPQQLEFRLCRKDNTAFWVIIAISPIRDERGEYAGTLALLTDINERKATEEALRASEQLLRRVLDTLPVGVWIAEGQGRLINGNPAGHRIWAGARYTGLEDYGEYKGWWADTHQPIAADEWALARAISRGETSINEVIEIEAFDGTHKIIHNSAMPLRDAGGEITGAIVVNADVTEQRRLEAERRTALEREKRIANELQECFRPSVPPHLPGYELGHAYRAALDEARLGGDFYDVFPLGEGRFGIVMGDVSGKGLDAAVHTVTAKYFLRGYAAEYADPVQVVRLLNEVLAAEISETYFLTLFYGVLEARTGRLRYVNAGHEPALVLMPGRKTPVLLHATGPLVGAFPGLDYEEQVIELEFGASLLLYTDGVSEARRDDRFLKTEGVADILLANSSSHQGQDLVNHVLADVRTFAGGELRDDVTLLLVQRSAPALQSGQSGGLTPE
ncbi:MAG: SpoIIE family protein phosphatase [Actinomycetota bacterium]